MNKKILTALSSFIIISGLANAQVNEPCGTATHMREAVAKNPALASIIEQYNTDLQKRVNEFTALKANSAGKSTAQITIPVVFHVILTQAELDALGTNSLNSRITSQIEVLNTDFNAANTDTVPTVFQSLKGNAGFSFGLAHRKPDGTGTTGIDLKIAPAGFGGFDAHDASAKNSVLGGLNPWDNTKYLNVWIVNIKPPTSGGDILGYAYSPWYAANIAGDPNTAGIVVDYLAFGKRKSGIDNFFPSNDKGRTMVHEMGHFFTLFHIWGNTAVGSGNCSDDDGVTDTPPQKDANQSTCPSFPKANCTNTTGGEMFMNYMDYVTDFCMRMFSKGQVARMQSEFAQGGGSFSLQWNPGLLAWPTGIDNIAKENSFEITPNPSNGIFNIAFMESGVPKYIIVTNSLGQLVKRVENINNMSAIAIDLTGMSKGVYAIQFNFEGNTVTRKVVLQ